MATPSSRAQARLHQLCCLGLGGQAVMPALLEELHDLIPSYSNAFFWTDQALKFSNLYDENPVFPQIAPVYMGEFYNRREREVLPSFTDSMRDERGVKCLEDVLKVRKKSFYEHDFYDLIYRPLGYRQFIRVVVREHGRALGRVNLYRADDRPFTAREKQRLATVAPFIAHAQAAASDVNMPLVAGPDSGVIIAERSGRLQYLSSHARRLLWMATNPGAKAGAASGGCHDDVLPEEVRRLYRQLAGVFKADDFAAPPVWRHRNPWGGFTFRVYWLNDQGTSLRAPQEAGGHDESITTGAPEPTRLIVITVHREEPLPLKLLRRMEQLPLSGRQMQMCLLLSGGHSLAAIAERLSLSRHTVDYHCREVYARFDVHTRGELIGKLSLL